MDTITSRRELLRDGFSPDELRRLLRDGRLVPVRPGAYVIDALPTEPEALHVVQTRAALLDVAQDSVVSHVSAAIVHGLPVWGVSLRRVHLTRARRAGARCGSRVHLHAAALDPDEVVQVEGIAVTSVARTVVDVARSVPFEQAVAVLDAALHRGLTSPGELAAAVAGSARRPGVPAARRAISFADGLAESVGESRSRVAMAVAGLPDPVLQHLVLSHRGKELGRVDFWWPQLGVVGEFDGRVKYGRLVKPGQDAADAVYAEKLREDAIRGTGVRMVRWTWPDLGAFAAVAERITHDVAARG